MAWAKVLGPINKTCSLAIKDRAVHDELYQDSLSADKKWGVLRQKVLKCLVALRPCYTVQFSQQLVSQCHCETSCWRIEQCNMGCLAIFLLREVLHEVELRSTFRNRLQQLTTPLHNVSPLQQLVSQFYSCFTTVLTRAHAHTYLYFVLKSIARQVPEEITQCNRASTPNLGNLQRYIFNRCETS